MIRNYEYDVVVIGGGSAGVAAAIGASECNAKTLLVERNPYLGGEATHSNVISYCGFFTRGEKPDQVVFGVGERVLQKLRDMNEDTNYFISKATGNASIRFNPEKLKIALDGLIEESSIDLLLNATMIEVKKSNNKIEGITCMDDEGYINIKAKAFIDATGDGNVANLTGLETLWGDEDGKTQMASLSVRIDNLPKDEDINPKDLEAAIIQGKKDGIPYLHKEKGLIIKIPFEDYGFLTIPSLHIDDLTAETLTNAEINLRKQAQSYVEVLKKYVPYLKDIRLVSTGPKIGIRESRRVIGEEALHYKDILSGRKRENSIGRGGWSPEIHKDIKELIYIHIADNDYYDIPISTLKAKDIINLWCCGRNISCDSISHSSVRVMGTSFVTGQGAGVSAALTLDQEEYDIVKIQNELKKQGALI
ncbi:FAD-dependent oxidoreductase [Tissierella praeacuta]|uniref:FAD-dependent oxidoreductase n=1 Tax=Tissierella praeacuta TaxID=43131 RepID=UPI0033418390